MIRTFATGSILTLIDHAVVLTADYDGHSTIAGGSEGATANSAAAPRSSFFISRHSIHQQKTKPIQTHDTP